MYLANTGPIRHFTPDGNLDFSPVHHFLLVYCFYFKIRARYFRLGTTLRLFSVEGGLSCKEDTVLGLT